MQEQIVGLLNPIIALIYSAGFFALWLRTRHQRYILALVFAGLARAAGIFLDFAFPNELVMIGVLLPFLMFTGGITALVWAICDRCGQRSQLEAHFAIVTVGAAMIVYAGLHENFFALAVITSTALGLIVASGAQTLANAAARTLLDKLIMWLTALYAAQFFIRPSIAMVMEPALTSETYAGSAYHAVLIVTFAVMTILHSTTLIAAIMVDQFRVREEAAEADPLTGLKIRRVFEKDSVTLLDRASKDNVPVSMIVADLDHFKQVNDLWGHQAGDKALTTFGELMIKKIRRSDVAGRIGGEEFCIMVWNCKRDAAERLAERIRSSFAQMKHESLNDDIRLTASFGVAEWQAGEGYGKLYARADSALYNAKYAGRDRVVTDREDEKAIHDGDRRKAADQIDRRKASA